MVSKKVLVSVVLLSFIPLYANAESGTIPVDVDGTSYSIDFETGGVTVSSIIGDADFISIIFGVEVTGSPGIFEVTFQREHFDAVFEGEEVPFIVLADGDEPPSEETETTSETRTIRIELAQGTEEVEIIGERLLDGTFGSIQMIEEQETVPEEEPEVPEEEEEMVTEEPEMTEETETVPEEEEEEMTPTTQCGSGTILKDGACVLDERCGTGTHFEDGQCVLDEKTSEPSGVNLSFGTTGSSQIVVSAIIAFGIALAVITILAIIARGRKRKQAQTY